MDKVKGFKNLTKGQQDILITTNARHVAGVGTDEKDGYTPVEVAPMSPVRNKIKVWFKNGEWLYYLPDGSWY